VSAAWKKRKNGIKNDRARKRFEKSCQPIKARHLKTQRKNQIKITQRTFVLSAIEVTGFPRLSTRSVPYAIAFASVLSVFLIDFAFCNILMIHFFLNLFSFLFSFNWIGDTLHSNSQRDDDLRDQNLLYSFSQKRKTALDLSLSYSLCVCVCVCVSSLLLSLWFREKTTFIIIIAGCFTQKALALLLMRFILSSVCSELSKRLISDKNPKQKKFLPLLWDPLERNLSKLVFPHLQSTHYY